MSRTLYRTAQWAVTLVAVTFLLGQILPAQFAKKSNASKGPRALGLLELAANGKAHLVPVAILIDGQFYDASVYKAAPVPMALESGIVYEAVRSGTSQGLFTVSGALATKTRGWVGAGTWRDSASIAAAAEAAKKKAEAKPPSIDAEIGGPPVLHRGNAKAPEAPKVEKPAPPAPEAKAPATPPAPSPERVEPEDPNRPVLRRGKPAAQPKAEDLEKELAEVEVKPTAKQVAPEKSNIQVIPAISDAGGPEPLPFLYAMKDGEEAQFRARMQAMAAEAILAQQKQRSQMTASAAPSQKPTTGKVKTAPKPAPPSFHDINFHVFDLSNNNEPVMVLTATVEMASAPDVHYFVTVVGRQNIYGDMRKVYANVTDQNHLDVIPRMEFLDAVDADGDGRGELLFRKVSDTGSAFSIYRVIGEQLWPLFEGALGS
ncbi:MAG: hypothetical protein JST79_12600 [Acidobacteria bacterium]|nr:hypothetical protein [Acidobacteriota bacterium]